MSEFEKLKRARMYIHKLANGIDPISNTCIEQDSILNNIRISRCFFYVVEVLDQLIANSGVIGKNKTSIPFFITEEQKAKILPIERKVLVGQITDKINAVTAENNCKKFNAVWITNWLLEHGYLEIKSDARGHNKRFATLKGYEIGIAVESRNGRYGVFNINTYNEDKFGFPCQIEDDPIMKLVVHEDTTIPFAEERRLFYVALTRTKNYVYIITPENRPSRFLIELIKDANIPYPDNLKFHIKEKFRLRCPVCNYPLKQEFNKNYGLMLFMCTNEPEICDFMTNSRDNMYDIFKCPKCADGYMIVRMNQSNGEVFYGCTNFNNEAIKCNHTQKITTTSKKASI